MDYLFYNVDLLYLTSCSPSQTLTKSRDVEGQKLDFSNPFLKKIKEILAFSKLKPIL